MSLLLSLESPLLKQLKHKFIEEMNYIHVNIESLLCLIGGCL